MEIFTSLVVGVIAGVLASRIVGRIGFGVVGDIVLGLAGGLAGTYVSLRMGWHVPVIAVSAVSAAIVLAVAHTIHYAVIRRRFA